MAIRNYSSTSPPRATSTSLASATPGDSNTVTLSSSAGLPATPFTASLERGTANEELVLVTAVVSGVATIIRGYDGTSTPSHSAGVPLEHVVSALDYAEANAHINAATGVHGASGSVVGTTGAQSLDAKTLTRAVGAAGSANAAIELRRYDADTTQPLVRAASQDGSTTLAQMDGAGKLGVPSITDPTLAGTVLSFDAESAYFDPSGPSDVPVVIRATSGQTANLVNIRDGAGALRSWFTPDARGVLASKSSVGLQLNPATAVDFAVFGAAIGDIPLAAWGVSGQTEDLFIAYNDPSSGTRMAGVKSDGRVYTPAVKLSITGGQSGGTSLIAASAVGADATNYPFGTSLREAAAADGWPADGLLETHRYANRIWQRFLGSDGRVYWRTTTTTAGPTWAVWRGGAAGYGEVEYQESTTDETSGSGGTALRDLPITHATFTLPEARVVLLTANIPLAGSAGDAARIRVTNSGGTDVAISGRVHFTSGTVLYETKIHRRLSLAAGSYDWRARVERTLGTGGNVWMPAATATPGFILVEDIGLAN